MIPGVLATLAAVLLSGRADWQRRIVYFGLFGALGWSFGGSISYMQVIGYTHSGHSASVLYGFANLFVIGFLWAAIGGAGASLPAFLSRERLTEIFVPLIVLFAAWTFQDFAVEKWFPEDPAFRHEGPLYWYDTDWVAALVAIVAILFLCAIRRRVDFSSSLILHMAIGWWAGFLVLVNLLDLRMTPPRGDNWAGCVGMVLGMWLFFQRQGLSGLTLASVVTGLIGGFGFATGNALKLTGMMTNWNTNWHSILEQTYGFINGIGLAVALFWLARLAPQANDDPPVRKWTEPFAAGFVLLVISWLNLSKNPEVWVKAKAIPGLLYGISAQTWFNLAYLSIALAFVILVVVHRTRPLPFLTMTWFVRGQLFYLVFLWLVVMGNFERTLVSFAPTRIVTEGVIFLNAVLCSIGIFVSVPARERVPAEPRPSWPVLLRKTIVVGLMAAALSIIADWAMIRGLYGDRQASHAAKHIRFGPNATATKEKPPPGKQHP